MGGYVQAACLVGFAHAQAAAERHLHDRADDEPADDDERDNLVSLGWNNEGDAWNAPATSSTPVYRLYNPNAGEHHYTMSAEERDNLVSLGWNDENIGWYSDDAQSVPLYRVYNPNEFANNHHYTASVEERDWLVSLGWNDEDIAWYGLN